VTHISQITYEEIGKAKAIEQNLDFLASVIHRLELNAEFPQGIADAQLDNVECAALDVFTAVMEYLTNGIRYFSKPLIGQ
jgi:hypothetical protein